MAFIGEGQEGIGGIVQVASDNIVDTCREQQARLSFR